MGRKLFLCMGTILGALVFASQGNAMIFISEILADPATGIEGDANGDGVRSSSGDEFIEIFNDGNAAVDLTGWRLSDAVSTRHFFTEVIGEREYLAIFGSSASTGALSLNNSADIISLFDKHDNLMDQVSYGTLANNNQSIVRLENDWVLHTAVSNQLFSPGTSHTTAVPEPISALTFGLGFGSIFARRRLLKS